MKSKMSKVVLFTMTFFAAIIVLGTMTALANPNQPNLSGVDPDAPVTLTIHYYRGGHAPVHPGGPVPDPPERGVPVPGVTFLVQRVEGGQTVTNPNGPGYILTGYTTVGAPVSGVTNPQGQILFTNAQLGGQGIFRVTEVAAPGITGRDTDRSWYVSLPMVNPAPPTTGGDGTDWLYDVNFFVKPDDIPVPGFEKSNVYGPINPGDIVTWEFDVEIMQGIEHATLLRVIDTLDPRLQFIPTSVVATFTNTTGGTSTLTAPTHFTVSYPATGTTADGVAIPANTVIFTITQAGFDHLADQAAYSVVAGEWDGRLTFRFETQIVVGTGQELGRIYNRGRLEYNEERTNVGCPPTDPDYPTCEPGYFPPPFTDVFNLSVRKVDVDDNLLNGAVFRLYRASDIENGAPVTGAVPFGPVTTVNGIALFPNLQAGTYYLYEVSPPPGFNRITTLMQVTIGANTATGTTYVVSVTVVNSNDFELPNTGGMGTLMFTAVGLVLMGGSVLFFVAHKRKESKNR